MPHQTSFTVKTPADFFAQIVLPQYQEFVENNSSVRHALLSIITVYHMGEWVYGDGARARKAVAQTAVADDFEIARKVTNGTKHFKNKIVTRAQTGFSSGFSNAFARPLSIQRADGSETSADELLSRLIGFWKSQNIMGVF